jgi:hypothetical protein
METLGLEHNQGAMAPDTSYLDRLSVVIKFFLLMVKTASHQVVA